jgi:hypothetical protein
MDRFWNKVNKQTPTGCWEWTGASEKGGYGLFKIDNVVYYAHRCVMFWENKLNHMQKKGDRNEVDHICRNPSCVNPGHLRVLSPEEHRKQISVRNALRNA